MKMRRGGFSDKNLQQEPQGSVHYTANLGTIYHNRFSDRHISGWIRLLSHTASNQNRSTSMITVACEGFSHEAFIVLISSSRRTLCLAGRDYHATDVTGKSLSFMNKNTTSHLSLPGPPQPITAPQPPASAQQMLTAEGYFGEGIYPDIDPTLLCPCHLAGHPCRYSFRENYTHDSKTLCDLVEVCTSKVCTC